MLSDKEYVWVKDEDEAYLPAIVISREGDAVDVELVDPDRTLIQVSSKQILSACPDTISRALELNDLVSLPDLAEAGILHVTRERFYGNQIYTLVGTMLIAINPFQDLDLYSRQQVEKYKRRGEEDTLPPHVFDIARDAYNQLSSSKKDQSIVISGESGAGKTEATKQCLQFLAEITGSESNIEQRILSANPILEAFGNAKTVRNNNSSRFGKYLSLFFKLGENSKLTIVGAQTTNYLLEKVRVVKQAPNERNYHIFFQLLRGASEDQAQELGITHDPKDFAYLNKVLDFEIKGVSDAEDFVELESAFRRLEFTENEISFVISTVAAILHLGNLRFQDTGDRSSKVADLSKASLNFASSLLKVSADGIARSLTSQVFSIPGKKTTSISSITLSSAEASEKRDAMAKFLYGELFDWLVDRMNRSVLGPGKAIPPGSSSVGVLDIFGFEAFELNSFEQLCINFTNEKVRTSFIMT
jgi:myosin heavy subunit